MGTDTGVSSLHKNGGYEMKKKLRKLGNMAFNFAALYHHAGDQMCVLAEFYGR